MRVGFDARWYNDSGVGTHVAELLKALVPLRQANFELIVYEDPENPVPGLPDNSLKRIPVSSRRYSPLSHIELRRRAREDGLDLFHSPFYPVPLGLPCPVVVTLHDLIPFLFSGDGRLKRLAVKSGYRMAAKRSHHIIAVSHQTAADIQKILQVPSHKITVIHNAASGDYFHPNGKPGEALRVAERFGIRAPYVIVASARNWRTKNLFSALLALSTTFPTTPFQTVVYGPPDGLKAAGGKERWKRLGIVETGYLTAPDLAALFRHAQLFLFPSLYEGFGLPVLEAMACGCAVITSNAGSLAEIAGDGAQTFAPRDLMGITGAVNRLWLNPKELAQWQQRALRRAADFSWSRTAQETLSVYHRTVPECGH